MQRSLFLAISMLCLFGTSALATPEAPVHVVWDVTSADSTAVSLVGRMLRPKALPAGARVSYLPVDAIISSESIPSPGTLQVTLIPNPGTDVAAVTVRIDDAGSLMHVDELFLGRGPGASFVRIARQEFAQRQAAAHHTATRDRLLARAGELAAAARARGKRPVYTTEDDAAASPFVSAWSEVVKVVARVDPVCGQFVLTANNVSYPVSGTLEYYDTTVPRYVDLRAPNNSATLETIVEMENLCNEVIYRPRWWYATTAAGGAFSFPSVTTAEPAGSWDPANRFMITTEEVGLWLGGVSMQPVDHEWLTAASHQFHWTGTAATIKPRYYLSTYGFLFRWNNELSDDRDFWNAAGLGQFVNFRAGFDPTPDPNDYAHFEHGTPPGLVVIGGATWTIRFNMAHEFGHAFHYQLQGQVPFPSTVKRVKCELQFPATDAATAIVEGFADWHAVAVSGEDFGPVFYCWDDECYHCDASHVGFWRPTNVSAFFWDVFDSTNHSDQDSGLDTVTYALTLLANWRNGSTYGSFDEFYNDYQSRGLWTIPGTSGLRVINHVDVPY